MSLLISLHYIHFFTLLVLLLLFNFFAHSVVSFRFSFILQFYPTSSSILFLGFFFSRYFRFFFRFNVHPVRLFTISFQDVPFNSVSLRFNFCRIPFPISALRYLLRHTFRPALFSRHSHVRLSIKHYAIFKKK